MTNVFISWSGDQSKAIAEELRNWIPSVLQFARPYFTPNDIEKGAKWGSEISKKLAESNVGIICLTKDNVSKPWILFESGALSKDLEKSKVCSVLFGMETTDLSGPLTIFQTTNFEKSDFKRMMSSINESGGQSALNKETFDRVFDMWWPQIEERIQAILKTEISAKDANLRSDRDLLEEILLTTRSMSRSPRTEDFARQLPLALITEFLDTLDTIFKLNDNKIKDDSLNDLLKPLIGIVSYLSTRTGSRPAELEERISNLKSAQSSFIPF